MKLTHTYREEVLRKELEWLPDLIPERVADFTSKKLDLNDLAIKAELENVDGFDYRFVTILLLDENGVTLGLVGVQTVSYRIERSWLEKLLDLKPITGSYLTEFEETVEEALARLRPESSRTQYILSVTYKTATLIKVPKGTTIDEHLKRKQEVAKAELAEFIANA